MGAARGYKGSRKVERGLPLGTVEYTGMIDVRYISRAELQNIIHVIEMQSPTDTCVWTVDILKKAFKTAIGEDLYVKDMFEEDMFAE